MKLYGRALLVCAAAALAIALCGCSDNAPSAKTGASAQSSISSEKSDTSGDTSSEQSADMENSAEDNNSDKSQSDKGDDDKSGEDEYSAGENDSAASHADNDTAEPDADDDEDSYSDESIADESSADESSHSESTESKTTSEIVNMTNIDTREFTAGGKAKITGKASGGTGKYSYEFYYKRAEDDDWMPFGNDQVAYFSPELGGEFVIRTYAKDSDGSYALKDFTVTVHAPLENTTTVSETSFTVGKEVSVKVSATGGMGKYKFQLYYKRKNTDEWLKFSTAGSGTFKPESAGEFTIRSYVTDAEGNTAKKDFELTAKEKPKASKAENS